MKNTFSGLLIMLVTIVTGTPQAIANGDVGSEECRVVHLNAQHLVESAVGNSKAEQRIGIFKAHMAVQAAKMAGQITRQCAWCIRKQIIRNIDIDRHRVAPIHPRNAAMGTSSEVNNAMMAIQLMGMVVRPNIWKKKSALSAMQGRQMRTAMVGAHPLIAMTTIQKSIPTPVGIPPNDPPVGTTGIVQDSQRSRSIDTLWR